MALTEIGSTTTPTAISDYSISPVAPDSPRNQDETYWDNLKFTQYFGNYKAIAKIKKAIDGYATWVIGKGYVTNPEDQVDLDHVTGWGEDTFNSILWNSIVTKKINGDSFSEIIRDTDSGILLNLKPLNPQYMRTVVNRKGRIIRYEYRTTAGSEKSGDKREIVVKYEPSEILHLCNNRVVDEMHGVSDVEAVQWIVEFQEEAVRDLRKLMHRNGVVRVIEIDMDNPAKLALYKVQWKDAIEKGDVLLLPKGIAEAKDWHGTIDFQGILAVIEYLDSLFYMTIGVPRVILGGAENSIEASSKIGTLNFEQVYQREQTELEADIWNQLGIKITFNKPASLMENVQDAEAASTSQT